MGMPVNTVATGGLAIVESSSGFGTPVSEAAPGRGVAVTKIVGGLGLPVIFDTVVTVVLDVATVTAVTLSNGGLTATNTGTTSVDQGARVANSGGKIAGKYYYETTLTTLKVGGNGATGIGTTASTYTNMGNSATVGVTCYIVPGNIWANGGNSGSTLGTRSEGHVLGVAIDLDNRKAWFRVAPSGNWNGSGTANPATNVGGVTIPAGTMVPIMTFGGVGGLAGTSLTSNFGGSAFTGAVPSGFTSGWPA